MAETNLFRGIPKVDDILRVAKQREPNIPHTILSNGVRNVVNQLRVQIQSGQVSDIPDSEHLVNMALEQIRSSSAKSLHPVINGTGVVLHTNLGRAPLAESAARAATSVACSYSNLEFDTKTGKRGSRYSHIEPIISELTDAEAALVVNNNAAAVLLVLSALGCGKECVISRGELVEIGGAFRVPDIMEACGCFLREVGTTNKTRLSDYENAITEQTFAIIKVHTSNFRIIGFSESTSTAELSALAQKHDLPLIYDLGSGLMVSAESVGLGDEPDVRSAINDGADLVCFSGDKLFGGPQAGIIIGKRKYIDIIRRHPLMRAMRVDKMTLAALEDTLQIYRNGTQFVEIPVLSMLSADSQMLRSRAETLQKLLRQHKISATVIQMDGQAGGGSAPTEVLPGWGISIDCSISANELASRLLCAEVAVVCRIINDCVCLDVRTVFDTEIETLVSSVVWAVLG